MTQKTDQRNSVISTRNNLGSFEVNQIITYSEPVNFIDRETNYTGRGTVLPPDDQ